MLETYTTVDDLIQSSLEGYYKLEWIPYSEITDLKPSPIDAIHHAVRKKTTIMLFLLGKDTPEFVSEFARIYSLPTHEYINSVSHFRRYSYWLSYRNDFIYGFTKYDDNNYMVARRDFYHFYSRYGFCT